MSSQIALLYRTLHRPRSPCHSKWRRSIRNSIHYPFYVWYCIRSILYFIPQTEPLEPEQIHVLLCLKRETVSWRSFCLTPFVLQYIGLHTQTLTSHISNVLQSCAFIKYSRMENVVRDATIWLNFMSYVIFCRDMTICHDMRFISEYLKYHH